MSRQTWKMLIATLGWVMLAALVLLGAWRSAPAIAAVVIVVSGGSLVAALMRRGLGWHRQS